EIALLRQVPRTATVIAVSRLEARTLAREEFLAAVTGNAESAQGADEVISARLQVGWPGLDSGRAAQRQRLEVQLSQPDDVEVDPAEAPAGELRDRLAGAPGEEPGRVMAAVVQRAFPRRVAAVDAEEEQPAGPQHGRYDLEDRRQVGVRDVQQAVQRVDRV